MFRGKRFVSEGRVVLSGTRILHLGVCKTTPRCWQVSLTRYRGNFLFLFCLHGVVRRSIRWFRETGCVGWLRQKSRVSRKQSAQTRTLLKRPSNLSDSTGFDVIEARSYFLSVVQREWPWKSQTHARARAYRSVGYRFHTSAVCFFQPDLCQMHKYASKKRTRERC